MKITHILHPTDFSDSSKAAMDYVKDLARQNGSEVTLMYVMDDIGKAKGWYVPHTSLNEFYKEMEDNAMKNLERCCYEEFRDLKTKRVVAKGLADEEIVKYADEKGVDLIVMGTYNRSGMDFVFGSTVARVLKKAKCPVLCVKVPAP